MLVCISITSGISKLYIFIDFTPLTSETLISNNMPVQTRHKYHTRNTSHQQPILKLEFAELSYNNKRNLRNRTHQRPTEVFYSDQESIKPKGEKKCIDEPQELSFEPGQREDDKDCKTEDIAKTCRPPPKRGKKKGTKFGNSLESNNLNTRSKKIVSEIAQIGSRLNPLEVKIQHDESSKSRSRRGKKAIHQSIDLMLTEETVDPIVPVLLQSQEKTISQNVDLQKAQEEQEKRRILQQQMQLLARLDSQSTDVVGGPFYVFPQYRTAIESKIDMQYRQFLRKNQNMGESVLRQQINFNLSRQRDLRKQMDVQAIEEEKELFCSFRELNDYLFYKCKDMDEQKLMEYKGSAQYNQILLRLMHLHPYNSYRQEKPKRKPTLKIDSVVSEKFSFVSTKKETTINPHKTYSSKSNLKQSQASRTPISSIGIIQKKPDYLQVKMQSENLPIPPFVKPPSPLTASQPAQDQTKMVVESKQTSIPLGMDPFKLPPQIEQQRRNELRKKFQARGEQFIEPVKQDLSMVDYDREKILQIIHNLNQRNLNANENGEQKNERQASDQVLSQTSKSKTPSVKSQVVTNSIKPSSKQLSQTSNHSQVLSTFEINQPKFEGLEQIEIITRQSAEKTEQTTRHQRASTNTRNDVKSTRYNHSQNWDMFSRGPKVKRLEILNRFHYNPFEIENGEDQCDLWRRLMSEEIQDLKSHYKYEEPNEYFLNENEKYEKGYVLPLKVKQQDFYIPSLYDPQTKSLRDELQFNSQAIGQYDQGTTQNEAQSYKQTEQFSVKKEIIENENFVVTNDRNATSFFSDQKYTDLNQRTTQQPKSPLPEKGNFESKLEQSGKSFNFDLLQGFELPQLASDKEEKVVELDFF